MEHQSSPMDDKKALLQDKQRVSTDMSNAFHKVTACYG